MLAKTTIHVAQNTKGRRYESLIRRQSYHHYQLTARGSILEGSSPSRGCRDGLEVYPTRVDEMLERVCPVLPGIPGYFARCVHFNWHDLADVTALDEDDRGANTATAATALLAALNVGADEGIVVGDIRPWDDMGALDGKSDRGVISDDGMYFKAECLPPNGFRCGRMIGELDEQGVLTDVGGETLQLERLESRPTD